MKIIHVSASSSRTAGGVATVLWGMLNNSPELLHQEIVTYRDEYTKIDVNNTHMPHMANVFLNNKIGFSFGLPKILARINSIDVIHSHGLWLMNGYYAMKEAKKRRVPLVISTHGMMEPYSIKRSSTKKKIVSFLYENKNIKQAACIHAASEQEANNIRLNNIVNPIAIIPFGFEEREQNFSQIEKVSPVVKETINNLGEKKILLFLSRIHPKKGLDILIHAFSRFFSQHCNWHLIIAGPDEGGYQNEIKNLVKSSNLENEVSFIGPVYGDDKYFLFSKANIFVLPTHSENYGFVIPEALSSGLPVITTKGTPWNELVRFNCGWWVDIGIEPLYEALIDMNNRTEDDMSTMKENAIQLINENYTWKQSMSKFVELYEWLKGHRTVPSFIDS